MALARNQSSKPPLKLFDSNSVSHARHQRAWEIWTHGMKKRQAKPHVKLKSGRHRGSLLAETLDVPKTLFLSPLAPPSKSGASFELPKLEDLYKSDNCQSRKSDKRDHGGDSRTLLYWKAQGTEVAPKFSPVKKNRGGPAKSAGRTRRTSCFGGELYRAQLRQAKVEESTGSRRDELADILRSRIAQKNIKKIFQSWDADGNGFLNKVNTLVTE
jgi:hypothetical protein